MKQRRMPRARSSKDDGSAIVEFVIVALVLMVPLSYLLVAAVRVHSAVFASTQAVREAGRAFTLAPEPTAGRVRAESVAQLAFADQGLELPTGALAIRCVDGPCLAPGTAVDVSVDWRVALPWVPDLVEPDRLSIPISARQRVPVDEYRSSGLSGSAAGTGL